MNSHIKKQKKANVSYLSAPSSVWWDVTNRCNLSCLHCYSSSRYDRDNSDELSTTEAKRLISELAEIGVFFIYFLGGEPFIRPDFLELVEHARTMSIGVTLSSNGWFITKEIAKKLGILRVSQVSISIDGASPDMHDFFRNTKGSFEHAIRALENLRNEIQNIGIVSTITRHNIHEVDGIFDLAAGLGARNLQFLTIAPVGRGSSNYDDCALSDEETSRLKEILEKKISEYSKKMLIHIDEGLIPDPCNALIRNGRVKPDFMGCGAARTCCNIDYNGNVIPCLHIREPVAGNVKETRFKEIWDHSPVFMQWRQKRLRYEECAECDFSDICNRECPLSDSQRKFTGQLRREIILDLKNKWEKSMKSIPSSVQTVKAR